MTAADCALVDTFPSAPLSFCERGSKSSVPASVNATVISGEVTKPCVAGLASFRPVKFLVMTDFIAAWSANLSKFYVQGDPPP